MKTPLCVSLITVAFTVGIGVGFGISPSYATMRSEQSAMQMELGPADPRYDLRYIDGMIAHHKSAIFMAEQAKESKRKEIRELAAAIISIDEKGIEDLYTLKNTLYRDTREINQFEKIRLGDVDDTFDLRFLNALTTHHEVAIRNARDVRTKSTRSQVIILAGEVETALGKSLSKLQEWRRSWYGTSE